MGKLSNKLLSKLEFKRAVDSVQKTIDEKKCAFCHDLANGAVVLEFKDEAGKTGTYAIPLCLPCTRLDSGVFERRMINEINNKTAKPLPGVNSLDSFKK